MRYRHVWPGNSALHVLFIVYCHHPVYNHVKKKMKNDEADIILHPTNYGPQMND